MLCTGLTGPTLRNAYRNLESRLPKLVSANQRQVPISRQHPRTATVHSARTLSALHVRHFLTHLTNLTFLAGNRWEAPHFTSIPDSPGTSLCPLAALRKLLR